MPSLRSPRSVLLRLRPLQAKGAGGAEEARTPDPLLAKEVLSQLSYGPGLVAWRSDVEGLNLRPAARRRLPSMSPPTSDLSVPAEMVGHSGLEPETSVLSGLRSNQLS